ncbi:MAG: aminotransferase class III-fold pyridoxal phosphate-dependent enzyme [Alphaproteobacteria bacterium]|nr:aminotransferase class III-fold pyridoxal phosphate-dependent enzyme [Alphaproteobacteria bacterium]
MFPSGITHDSRHLRPYGIYVSRAQDGRKWDADGNCYVDYFGGHGALILGHNHPEVTAAVQAAVVNGSHFGAGHETEVRWAQAVCDLVPCAEKVRFTSSGTEATLLALRLSRAHTGRQRIIHFAGHFHGWQDHVTSGYNSHFDGSPSAGVLPGVAEHSTVLPPGDIDALEAALGDGDVAAVILEPTGATFGQVPLPEGFLERARELTSRHGTILIFDEVVTGFRVSPGGAQAHYGVTPDVTTLAKIVAGGLPGGAVVGRSDIFDLLDFERSRDAGREKVQHQGTHNANPLAAAAGLATLEIIARGEAIAKANAFAETLRAGLNEVLAREGVPWAAYGTFSGVHIFTNAGKREVTPATFDPLACGYEELKARQPGLVHKLRLAMLVHGVDLNGWPGGTTSAAHDGDDMAKTLDAFAAALSMLKREGEI